MMGDRDAQKQLWSYQVNLDKRVRSDHPLRQINQSLHLDFVRPEVAKFYGAKGNVSEDPVVIVKMMLLLFLDDLRSERELMRIIPERLDYTWVTAWMTRFPITARSSVPCCSTETATPGYLGCAIRLRMGAGPSGRLD